MGKFKQRVSTETYHPAGRLVSLLSADAQHEDLVSTALALGRKAASYGETVLMLDCCGGFMMERAGVIYNKTLKDVVLHGASVNDALYITSNEHFTAAAIGDLSLQHSLGSLAALSMSYDWVFVIPDAGCSAAHISLASASDVSLLGYNTPSDNFMRAFWYIDAVRRRNAKFDPFILSTGPQHDAVDTALMLTDTVRDHLGAPPPYAGHVDDDGLEARLLLKIRDKLTVRKFAAQG